MNDIGWLLCLGVIYISLSFKTRDYYVVIREFRIVTPTEYGKGGKIENRYLHHFDDYAAARAFRDLHDTYAERPQYEDQQNINYLYVVPGITAKRASAKMTKKVHHEAQLLIETPYSVISALKNIGMKSVRLALMYSC